jgi:prepilin peptidase CpaA
VNAIPIGITWLVSIILVEAAVIDGRKLKVPNWLTFHLAAGGLAYAAWTAGSGGLLWAIQGLAVGLVVLLPLYAIGGMGAGDVKLMAGVGAWMGPQITLNAFVASAIVGALIALVMIARSGKAREHFWRMVGLMHDIVSIRDPVRLADDAAKRKPTMTLLPYAIPLAIGSIGYFAWSGLLF